MRLLDVEIRLVEERTDLSPSSELQEILTSAYKDRRIDWLFGTFPSGPWPDIEFIQSAKTMLAQCNVFYFYSGGRTLGMSWLEATEASPYIRKVHFYAVPSARSIFKKVAKSFFGVLKHEYGLKYLHGNTCVKFFHVVRLLQDLGFSEVYRLRKTFAVNGKVYDSIISFCEL